MESCMPYVWLAVILVMSVVEAITVQLMSIWFVIAAIVSLTLSLFSVPLVIQMSVFIVVSVLLLCLTRPFAKRFLNSKKFNTNSDRYIGLDAIVTETINNIEGTGQVKVSGSIWTARSLGGEIIKEGEQVKIKRIEGVKLIVSQSE